MRKLLYLIILCIFSSEVQSQSQPAVIDTFKAQIARAATIEDKFQITGQLTKVLMNINLI